MSSREIIDNMLQNLNENGLSLLANLFGDMDTKERYNKNTTPERLEELKQIEEIEQQRVDQEKAEIKADLEKSSYKNARVEHKRQQEFKALLIGKEKEFYELTDSVEYNDRYGLKYWELMLLANTYNNSLLDGSHDIFRYGFLKGRRAERAMTKKRIKKVA